MDVAARFAATVAATPDEVRLDVAGLCIAAHAHPGLDVDAWCDRFDGLAAVCPEPTFDGVRRFLFEHEAFRGNAVDYSDPENSFLDSVIVRRLGIPITLSVVMIEVGRRVGVDMHPVGMPGHFLVRDASREGVFCDPFHGGSVLDVDGCRRVFERVHAGTRAFHPSYLAPTPRTSLLARVLTNLEHGPLAADPSQLAWMCALHLAIPGLAPGEHDALARQLIALRARWS